MNPMETAWVAGLVEGEGWFGIRGNAPKIEVTSVDVDVIERLHSWTGVGNVHGPWRRPDRQPFWRWSVHSSRASGPLLEALLPFLLSRRAEVVSMIVARWKAAPPKRGMETHCIHGHAFEGHNLIVRANGTRKCRDCANERRRAG